MQNSNNLDALLQAESVWGCSAIQFSGESNMSGGKQGPTGGFPEALTW